MSGDVLFWSFEQKVDGFANMEKRFPFRTIKKGKGIRPLLSRGESLTVDVALDEQTSWTLDEFMTKNKTAGLLII
ncbi:MAG: hypothetical protein AAFV29_08750, partial [Myxococcota bacterium]